MGVITVVGKDWVPKLFDMEERHDGFIRLMEGRLVG